MTKVLGAMQQFSHDMRAVCRQQKCRHYLLVNLTLPPKTIIYRLEEGTRS
jgi:hypothetical protein